MDDELDRGHGMAESTRGTLVEEIALAMLRLAALPFLAVGLVVWGVIVLAWVLARGLAAIYRAAVGTVKSLPVAASIPVRGVRVRRQHEVKPR